MKTLSKRLLNYVSNEGKYDEAAVIAARLATGSNKKAAAELGIPRRTVDRMVNRVVDRALNHGDMVTVETPNVLVMDIETAPILGYMWHFWKGGTSPTMMERDSYILSWAAKWLGEDEVMADAICYNDGYSAGDEDDTRMLAGIWNLLDEADFVVAHNGDRFDIKRLNTGFLLAHMFPPSPYRPIDTLKIAKRVFGFSSNRLDYILQLLEGRGKHDSGGFETWRACMAGDMEAWDNLIAYNKQDVQDLEDVYLKIRAWDTQHPSAATHGPSTGKPVCTVCGSEDVRARYKEDGSRKTVSTGVSVFPLYTCNDCGHHMRSRESLIRGNKAIFTNAK
jgi:hypothetical protein